MWEGLADEVDGAADVDVYDEVDVSKGEGVAVRVDELGV